MRKRINGFKPADGKTNGIHFLDALPSPGHFLIFNTDRKETTVNPLPMVVVNKIGSEYIGLW